jgi:hypothetical protein
MKKFLLPFFLFLSVATFSQSDNASKYVTAITPATLKEKLTIIAGAEMEGRETATPGQKRAAAYIEAYFKNIGLQPPTSDGYQLVYPVYQDTLEDAALNINDKAFQMNRDFYLPASSIIGGYWYASNIVFASYGLADSANANLDGLDVKDKWVMVIDGTPADMDRRLERDSTPNRLLNARKLPELRSRGAEGIIVISRQLPAAATAVRKGNMYTIRREAAAPVVYITPATAFAILQQPVDSFMKLKTVMRGVYPTKFSFNIQKNSLVLNSSDVIGVLPGTDKRDEYVFVTAHYDHLGKRGNVIYYGADDDGSGTTAVLQIATAFAEAKKGGNGPRRTIVFMAVSGEEKGLLGSEYYTDHHLFPMTKTSVDLNIDMIGRIDPGYKGDSMNYVYTIGEDKLSSDLFPITDSINKKYSNMELDRRFNDPNDRNRFYYRSDHYNFAKNGVPVIFYFNGVHRDYHRPTDTVDRINFDLMAKRTRLVYYTAWAMANRNEMLKRDIPLK